MGNLTELEAFLTKTHYRIESFKEAKQLYADKVAPEFSLFDYLRNDEVGISKCIGDLLNIEGKHAQGATFLNLFVKQIAIFFEQKLNNEQSVNDTESTKTGSNWAQIETSKCKVKLELSTDEYRRIDIHLKFQSGQVIGIENKPWAGDQKNQLRDYAEYLCKQSIGNPWLLIYLCNNPPSLESISEEDRINYEKSGNLLLWEYSQLNLWLKECLNEAKAPVVRTFIEELIKYIKKEINGEIDMDLSDKVTDVIEENLSTAMLVANSIDGVKRGLIQKLKSDLLAEANKRNYKLQWKKTLDADWTTYAGFGFNLMHDGSNAFEVWFEFNQSNLRAFYWGVRRKNEDIQQNLDLWSQINLRMSNKYGPSESKSTSWWTWWQYYDFENDFKNWQTRSEPWLAIKNGSIAPKLLKLVDEVNHLFSDVDLLK